jgi:hypothetical protein
LSLHLGRRRLVEFRRSIMDKKIQFPRIPKDSKSPARPSQDEVRENAEKWASSPGLQPPK